MIRLSIRNQDGEGSTTVYVNIDDSVAVVPVEDNEILSSVATRRHFIFNNGFICNEPPDDLAERIVRARRNRTPVGVERYGK